MDLKSPEAKAYLKAMATVGKAKNTAKVIEKARGKLYKKAAATATAAAAGPQDGNTFFEEIKCLGFYPQERRLEAVIAIKQPFGYGGNVVGSYEYVGLWVNWDNSGGFVGNGEDVGSGYVHVFDVPAPAKRLPYHCAVYRDIIPLPPLRPGTIVRARAILSWLVKPTGPNFVPVWGNRIDRWIRIDNME